MSAFPTITEQISIISRMIVPYILIALFLVLELVSLSFINEHMTQLPFLLIALFYWAVYRPTLLPLWLVFCMGFLVDIASTVPLGIHAILFTGIFWFIAKQRLSLIVQSYGVIWFLFGTILTGFYGIRWLVISGLNWHLFPLDHSGFEIMSGFLIFPFMTLFLHVSHKILPSVKGQISMGL